MFEKAKPIWVKNAKKEYNTLFGFTLRFTATDEACTLKVAAADCYQAYLNGTFLLAGPARSASGFFRQDALQIQAKKGENTLVFLVAEYNVNCYEYAENTGFLQAELLENDKVLAYTDQNTSVFELPEHVQKVQRYSFQRTFAEVYHLDTLYQGALRGERKSDVLEAEVLPEKNILPRKSNLPRFANIPSEAIVGGTMTSGENYQNDPQLKDLEKQRYFIPCETFKAYPAEELETNLLREICGLKTQTLDKNATGAKLRQGDFRIYDFGVNGCGFINMKIKAEKDCVVYITFDEILLDGDVCFYRLDCLNALKYTFKAGEYHTVSLEPYVCRYAKIYCEQGALEMVALSLKEVANPDVDSITFHSQDPKINKLFAAAVNTFKYNAVDIFMDCPSRERAGWLCDGYFTGKTEKILTGENKVEHDSLENFLLQTKFKHLPEGIVPMCFPASHDDHVYVPTWAMWFILELERYYRDSADSALVARAEKTVRGILDFLMRYENEYGLLENLESWVFIEWSKANELVDGVNYCANMLFALTLQKAGELYNDTAYVEKAESIRKEIRKRSFNGKFFTDHAVRDEDGKLVYQEDTTEVCQYYAFFTKTATAETYPELWQTLLQDFGPDRKKENKYPEVWFANAFVGNYLRLTLLNEHGLKDQLFKECLDYFVYMANLTNTLWEHDSTRASCNHGFASHIVAWITKL